MEHQPLAAFESIFEVNVKGVLRLTQKWLPTLRQQQGRIVMVSSIAGFLTIPRASAYCSSKHALEAITDGLRVRGRCVLGFVCTIGDTDRSTLS